MNLRSNVPLEEALNIAGNGVYSYLLVVMAGLVDLAAFSGIQLMSMVIPAAGCDLHLTTYQKGVLTSMVYTGMILTSHLWGFLADAYGRRRVMRFCSFSSILVTIFSSLAPNATTLMACCFLSGTLLAGIFTPIYVYVGECCAQEARAKGLLICCAISSMATVYLPAVAWVIIPLEINVPIFNTGMVFTSWRLYIALLIVPFILSSIWLLIMPETPKFLLSKGKHAETMKVLRKMYAKNRGEKEEDFQVISVCLDSTDLMPEQAENKSSALVNFFKTIFIQTKMIFAPPYLKYAVLSCLLCAAVLGVFNSIQLWFPETLNKLVAYSSSYGSDNVQLCDVMGKPEQAVLNEQDPCMITKDAFLINIGNGLLQSVFYYLFSLIAPKFSQKKLVVALAALSTLFCSLVIVVKHIILIIGAIIAATIGLLLIFPVFISIVVDFFPTSLRTNATSVIMLTGRISSVFGSQAIGALYSSRCELAYPGITAILIGMTVLFIITPTSRKL